MAPNQNWTHSASIKLSVRLKPGGRKSDAIAFLKARQHCVVLAGQCNREPFQREQRGAFLPGFDHQGMS